MGPKNGVVRYQWLNTGAKHSILMVNEGEIIKVPIFDVYVRIVENGSLLGLQLFSSFKHVYSCNPNDDSFVVYWSVYVMDGKAQK